jgi:RND family efflux transporter MFP subunit
MLESITATRPPLDPSEGLNTGFEGRRRGRWTWRLAGLALVGAVGLGATLVQGPKASPHIAPSGLADDPAVLTVTMAPAEIRSLSHWVDGDGSVVAWRELTIGAENAGLRVVELAAEEGDTVRRGQLLARFDDAVLLAQLAQAEAAVAEAEAIRQSAGSEFNRAAALSRGAFISTQTVEQRQSAARQADARLLSVRAHRDEMLARLAQTRVLAPADGLVLRRSMQLGAVSSIGQEMFRVVENNRMELDVQVPELDLARVHAGQTVEVMHGGQQIAAKVRTIAPMVAADTRVAVVHVALPEKSGLYPGMFAHAVIRTEVAPGLVVPQSALVFRDAQPAVFVIRSDDRVSLRKVSTGLRKDALVELVTGITEGESIVTSGAGFLSDGDHVRVALPLAVSAMRSGG